MTGLLLRGGLVFDGRSFGSGDVLVNEGGRIAQVGAALAAPDGTDVIDIDDDLVLPGFVNAHYHSPDNLSTGRVTGTPLELWSLASIPSRSSSPDELRAAALFGAAQLLRGGVTSVIDMVRPSDGLASAPLDAVAEAYVASGMRAAIAPVVADLPLERTLPLAEWRDETPDRGAVTASLVFVEEFARRWRGRDGRIDVHVAPSGPQRCSDLLLEGAVDLARRLGTMLHTHALETWTQAEQAKRRWGVPLVRHLERIGALGERTALAHLVWPDAGEMDAIAAAGAVVVHNPASNAILGSGRAPLPDLLARRITVALGTDAATCNDGLSIFEAMKLAAIIHRADEPDWGRWPTARAVLAAATVGGSAAFGSSDIGRLTLGARADLVVVDHGSAALVPPNDLAHQLVMRAGPEAVRRVYVGGRAVVAGGRVLTIDLPAVVAEVSAIAKSRARSNFSDDSTTMAIDRMLRASRARG